VAPAASSKGFVVQLGVFSNPDNARELVDKLNKQGIRAHMEARVQIGPFLNRQEADKAQSEMRKLGYNALVTQPYLAPPATR
jgi:DedD protein